MAHIVRDGDREVVIEVWGQRAVPKGSTTSKVVRKKGGEIVMRTNAQGKQVPLVVTHDAAKGGKPWAQAVHAAAQEAFEEIDFDPFDRLSMRDVRVMVLATFYFVRPKAHYGTGKNAGVLKDSAPATPITGSNEIGDVDKLLRGVMDPLHGIAFRKDHQVSDALPAFRYGQREGAIIRVRYPAVQTVGDMVRHGLKAPDRIDFDAEQPALF